MNPILPSTSVTVEFTNIDFSQGKINCRILEIVFMSLMGSWTIPYCIFVMISAAQLFLGKFIIFSISKQNFDFRLIMEYVWRETSMGWVVLMFVIFIQNRADPNHPQLFNAFFILLVLIIPLIYLIELKGWWHFHTCILYVKWLCLWNQWKCSLSSICIYQYDLCEAW